MRPACAAQRDDQDSDDEDVSYRVGQSDEGRLLGLLRLLVNRAQAKCPGDEQERQRNDRAGQNGLSAGSQAGWRRREGKDAGDSEWDLEQETRVCGRGEGDVHPL